MSDQKITNTVNCKLENDNTDLQLDLQMYCDLESKCFAPLPLEIKEVNTITCEGFNVNKELCNLTPHKIMICDFG